MPNCYLTNTAILVDRKLGLVRIYKSVLRDIGNPSYIVVDANSKSIKITRSKGSNLQAYNIERKLSNKRSPEIFNSILVQQIYTQNEHWDTEQPYFIYGDISADGRRAKFNFKDSVISQRKISKKSGVNPIVAIKETPSYNPDACVESLIYTAPSWISTIKRAALTTDYIAITPSAKLKLKHVLSSLSETAQTLIDIMEEIDYEQ